MAVVQLACSTVCAIRSYLSQHIFLGRRGLSVGRGRRGQSPTCLRRFKGQADTARWSTSLLRRNRMQRHRKAVYPQVSLVVLVIAVALVLAACGGGGGSGAEETSTTIPPASPTTAGAAAPTKAFADLVGTTLSTTEDTPEDVGNSLDLHVPMVLAFFVTGGTCLLYTSPSPRDRTR